MVLSPGRSGSREVQDRGDGVGSREKRRPSCSFVGGKADPLKDSKQARRSLHSDEELKLHHGRTCLRLCIFSQ